MYNKYSDLDNYAYNLYESYCVLHNKPCYSKMSFVKFKDNLITIRQYYSNARKEIRKEKLLKIIKEIN